jgi:O-antigen/teichoic acid export membrane protein
MADIQNHKSSTPVQSAAENRPRHAFLDSLKWAYTANWGERAFSALFMFILAALLGPRDFGILSIAVTYIAFLQIFLDQGLAAALIQRKDLESAHLDAVFWMDLILSVGLVAVSLLLSGWWAQKNHAPEAAAPISVISISIVFEALSVVQTAVLRRQMDFKSLSIRANTAVIISGVVGISMALAGFRVWALVAQQLTRDFASVILLWRLSPWRPSFRFSRRHLRDLIGFSFPNFTAQLANFGEAQAGPIILGLFFGPLPLGLYRLANRFVNSVVVMATSSIQAVSLPEFSRLQDQPIELRQSVLSCVRLSSAMTIPALTALASVSGPLMTVLGPQWLPAAPLLKILCIAGMCLIFAYFTGPLMQALARTRQLAVIEWIRTIAGIVLLILVGVAVRYKDLDTQITWIALSTLTISAVLIAPLFLYILMRLAKISVKDLLRVQIPTAVAALLVLASVRTCHFILGLWRAGPIAELIVECMVALLFAVASLVALDPYMRSVATQMLFIAPRQSSAPLQAD